jgi:hypothetical protein
MIRVRKNDGTTLVVEQGQFVEIAADTGEIGMVFFSTAPGQVMQVVPGSVDAARYENMFKQHGAKFNNVMIQRRP